MKKHILIGLIAIILAGGFIYYFFSPIKSKLSKSEEAAAVEKMLGRQQRSVQNVKTGNTTYDGKYLKFEYPTSATQNTYNKKNILKNPQTLESFQFQQISNPKYFFNILVQTGSIAATT